MLHLCWLVIVLVACGGGTRATAPTLTGEHQLAAGKLTLFARVIDGDSPALVLEAGGGADSTNWETLPAALARATGRKVIAYDRSGFGKSPLPAADFTVADELEALHAALAQLRATKVVFVAESYGAMMALAYIQRFPAELAGLVLLDPMNADFVTAVGIDKVTKLAAPAIAEPKTDKERAIARMVTVFPGLVAELAGKRWPNVRAVIVTAGIPWWPDETMRGPWRASAEALARTPDAELVVADRSKHDIAGMQPELVIAAVRRVLP